MTASAPRSEPPAKSPWLGGAALLLAAGRMAPSEAGGETGAHLIWVVGWLLMLIAMFGVAALRKRPLEFRFTAADVWLGVGCVLMAAMAIWGGQAANARAGWNMAWYWVGIAACLCVLRQTLLGYAERYTLIFLLWGLTIGLALHGIVQFGVTMPELVRQYEQGTEAERVEQLTAMDVDPTPGSPSRIQFENRLKSTEPYATFALANSLAGVLAPWLVVAVGLLLLPQPRRSFVVLTMLTAMVVGACLVLTKSRTALIAFLVGGAALVAADLRGARRLGWRLPLAGAAMVVAAIGGGVAVGALDKEVVTQALMSLAYRFEYWKATVAVIGEHWLTGVGSGNFQDYYGQHQLPQASELVADPHNFVLEIAATGGLITLIVFLVGWWKILGLARPTTKSTDRTDLTSPPHPWASRAAVWWCGAAGLIVGWAAALGMGFASERWLGLPLPPLAGAVGLALAWSMWRCSPCSAASPSGSAAPEERLDPSESCGRWLRTLLPITLCCSLLNLLAAGGISHWAVMQTVIVIGVLLPGHFQQRSLSPNQATFALLGLVVVLLALQFTALRPVIGAQQALTLAQQSRSADEAMLHLRAATKADPWSADPWQMMAQIKAAQGEHRQATWDLFDRALARDQRNAHLWANAAQWKLIASEFGKDPTLWAEAITQYRRAWELSPRGPARARLAWALHFGDETAQREARQHAKSALDWNDAHPHWEQKLDRIVLPSPNGVITAEQGMRKLRNSGNS